MKPESTPGAGPAVGSLVSPVKKHSFFSPEACVNLYQWGLILCDRASLEKWG